MDRTYLDDAEVGVGTTNEAVLVCTPDGTDRARLASLLRQDYPVRTADSDADALASLDRNVTVLVVDVTTDECSLDAILETGTARACRFQLATIVADSMAQTDGDRPDGVIRKPVAEQELRETVRWLHRRGRYDKTLAAFYALSEEYATLVTGEESNPAERRSLKEALTQLRSELDDVADALADDDALDVALSSRCDSSD